MTPREFLELCTTAPGVRQMEVTMSQDMAKAILAELAAANERANKAERELKKALIALEDITNESGRRAQRVMELTGERDALKKLVEEAVPYVEWLDRIVGHRSYIGDWLARAKEALK